MSSHITEEDVNVLNCVSTHIPTRVYGYYYQWMKEKSRIVNIGLSWLCKYDNEIIHTWRKILQHKCRACCNIFLHKWIISLSNKQSHDNSIIFIYFMTKVLDNFHSPPMVVAPWVDYGNYSTIESLIE